MQQQVEALTKQKEQLKESGQTSINSTDPEAHLMKSREGIIPAYNVQIVVDAENKLIADSEVSTNPDDHHLLPMMVASLVEEIGKGPQEVLADKGYYTPDLVEKVEKEHGCMCYIPYPEKKSNSLKEITFQYNHFTDSYICSEGKPLPLLLKNKHQHNSWADVYRGMHCMDCRLRQACTTSRNGRQLYRCNNEILRDRYKERLRQPLNQIKLAMRKYIVEHPFGTIKWLGGKIPLLLRGLKNTTTEINLYTTAYNLKRIFNIESFQTLSATFSTYQWRTP